MSNGVTMKTVAVGPRAPMMAISVMLDPQGMPDGSDRLQVQWPPQMPLPSVKQCLLIAAQVVEQQEAVQNGGILKATTIPSLSGTN